MKIGDNIVLIKTLLETNESYRDNDNALIATVWHKSLKKRKINSKDITGWKLLNHLSRGHLPAPESITRCRRKLQEQHKELRGTVWTKRHKKQKEVKKELSTITV